MKISFSLKNRGIGFYAELACLGLGFVSFLIYLIYSACVNMVDPTVLSLFIVGTLGAIFSLLTSFSFGPLIPVVFYALGFGFYINDRIIMFEEMINHITGMTERGAIPEVVIVVFVVCALAIIAGIVASFTDKEKKADVTENSK